MLRRIGYGMIRNSRLFSPRAQARSFSVNPRESQEESYSLDLFADVMVRPHGTPFLVFPVPPSNIGKKIPLTPNLTVDILCKLLLFNAPQAKIEVIDLATGNVVDPEYKIQEFMALRKPKTLQFIFNGVVKIFFKNPICSPSNEYLNQIDLKKIHTINWYQQCVTMGIPQDQASLLAMYLRNLDSLVEATGKPQMQVRQFMELMSRSTQTLIEPVYKEVNHLTREKTDRQLTIDQLVKEKEDIMALAEKRGMSYIYLLLLVTVLQFGSFYWTIFQVDWLGWDIMEPLTYSLQLVSFLLAMRYYSKYRTVRRVSDILKQQRERFINANPALKFRYHKIEANLDQLTRETGYIDKAVQYYRSRQKLL